VTCPFCRGVIDILTDTHVSHDLTPCVAMDECQGPAHFKQMVEWRSLDVPFSHERWDDDED
jgi:hypothetical protein